jgi:hypothetical protein
LLHRSIAAHSSLHEKEKSMFREWLSAAASSVGFFTGMTYWHELPTRQTAVIRKASLVDETPSATEQLGFVPAFKTAAD